MFSAQTDRNYKIEIPMSFNGYNIVEFIDSGSFSAVAKVQDNISLQFFAAKIIPLNDMKSQDEMNMIYNEINILFSIDHPNIIKIYNWFNIKNNQNDEFIVIIEEYCINGNLVNYMNNSGLNSEFVKKNIEFGLIKAIDYLHRNGIAHCDIKPDNVLIDENHSAKLCDFGFAKLINNSSDLTRWGTVGFNAPELYRSGMVNFIKSDIWSIGITLYTISEHEFPFQSYENAQNGILSILTSNEELRIVVEKCTRFQSDERPDASDLLKEKYFSVFNNIIDSQKILEISSKCNYKSKSYCLLVKKFNYVNLNCDDHELNIDLSSHYFFTKIEKGEKVFICNYDDKIGLIERKNSKNKRNYKINKGKKPIKYRKKFLKKVKKQKENEIGENYNQYFIFTMVKKEI